MADNKGGGGIMYQIIRFYKSGKKKKVCKYLTLEEAQRHCSRKDTRKEGVWFDGYMEIKKQG